MEKEKELFLLVNLIFFLITLLTILFVYLALHKMAERYRARESRYYIKKNGDKMYEYITEGIPLSRDLIPTSKAKRKAIEEILTRYSRNISGETVLAGITQYAEYYLSAYYRKCLKSRKWSVRMNGLFKIIDFRMLSLLDDVLGLLNSRRAYSREEYVQMYRVLALFKHKDFSAYLLQAKISLNEYEYQKLLFELDQQQVEELIACYDQLPLPLKYTIIEIIRVKNYIELVPFLEQTVLDETPEIRIRVLKALSQLGYVPEMDFCFPFISSSVWEERLMAARLLANSDEESTITYLRVLLKDESWWVRSQAAQSIAQLKSGKKILETIIEQDDDRFAQDMAREVLGKE